MLVSEHDGAVAVIRLDNPPVNGLSHHVRETIFAGIEAALGNPEIKAIVLTGAGKIFCGGADLRQFNTPAASAEPSLQLLTERMEASAKPIIAAIDGVAYGGGFELALACHYRVVSPRAQVALPEVKLGLIPGCGGTQRLPRLIGVAPALQMIVGGDPVDAAKAVQLGIADDLIEGDFLAGALAFAERMTAVTAPHPIDIERTAMIADSQDFFSTARAKAAKEKRGFPAPLECIACVEAAVNLPRQEGLAFERQRFIALLNGTESKALRHLFFAEREAAKITGLSSPQETRPITRVGVLGAGTMGAGIAMCFANADIPVTLMEVQQEALDRGLALIRKNYATTVSKGKLSQEKMEHRLGLIEGTLKYEAFSSADLVIEAVFEDMKVKKEVFGRLDQVCKAGAILASNTSRLDINEIAGSTSRPGDVIGLHFFSPANVMRLLEVVRGAKTADDVVATAMQLAKSINKIGVLVGVCDGFVGNRMLTPYSREANFLIEEGASVLQVDQALYDFGMAMGPFAMADMAGLDIGRAARLRQAATRPAHLRYSRVADQICDMGRFGQKTSAGFYRYETSSRIPIPDPEIEALIERCAREDNIQRGPVSSEEIVQRTIYALINEGARILEEEIAQRSSDIDTVYVNGYGFPAYRGGPMFYADSIGLDKVYARICEFHRRHGEYWEPAPLLERLAKEGKRFSSI
ncbi:Enoyl-CoA hydratase [Collimonas arenae]|uniref:Enoyl-CoA hydratase n=1 Tax=Collimonas arenae TaxID=279058 RepID=A0A0A1FHI4_9BURK|nr:3-hydroxyacyl-CoA dehydrogenase NAD-binding domain-containing protein [Collimonas arenae]AIY43099.1 Enoyl-CoA hydratase [Collimonas arenae]